MTEQFLIPHSAFLIDGILSVIFEVCDRIKSILALGA